MRSGNLTAVSANLPADEAVATPLGSCCCDGRRGFVAMLQPFVLGCVVGFLGGMVFMAPWWWTAESGKHDAAIDDRLAWGCLIGGVVIGCYACRLNLRPAPASAGRGVRQRGVTSLRLPERRCRGAESLCPPALPGHGRAGGLHLFGPAQGHAEPGSGRVLPVTCWTAVDPRTVRPGAPGELTERAWGGPLPEPCPRGTPAVAGAGRASRPAAGALVV